MRAILSSVKFKEMLNRVVKCAGFDSSSVITGYLGIKTYQIGLKLCTTDDINDFSVSTSNVEVDNEYMDITVPLDKIVPLISRITTESITLSVENDVLHISANGKYKMELAVDGQGNLLKMPVESPEILNVGFKEVSKADIIKIVDGAKQALAKSYEYPILTNYYVGERVIASDGFIVARLDCNLLGGEYVVSPKLMSLLALMDDNIKFYDLGNVLYFESNNCRIYHRYNADAEQYPSKEFNDVCDEYNVGESEHNKYGIKVRVKDMLEALDRVMLFTALENNPITLHFTDGYIGLASDNDTGTEIVREYEHKIESRKTKFECIVNGALLVNQLKAYPESIVDIRYGADNNIKLVCDDYICIVAINDALK